MSGKLLLIYICNFHVLSHLLLIYICKLHWNQAVWWAGQKGWGPCCSRRRARIWNPWETNPNPNLSQLNPNCSRRTARTSHPWETNNPTIEPNIIGNIPPSLKFTHIQPHIAPQVLAPDGSASYYSVTTSKKQSDWMNDLMGIDSSR